MTTQEAVDIILTVFRNVWNPLYYVQWPDIVGEKPEPVDGSESPWARVALKHEGSKQTSLSGELGTRIFTSKGFVVITLFIPIAMGSVSTYTIAESIRNAYRDARTAVWFTNARFTESGSAGVFKVVNVLIDFEYDEVR